MSRVTEHPPDEGEASVDGGGLITQGDGEPAQFAPATRAFVRRRSLVLMHRARSWMSRGGWMSIAKRLVYAAAYLVPVVQASITLGRVPRVTTVAFVVFAWGLITKASKQVAPEHLTEVARNYLVRKFGLSRLIQHMHRMGEMSPHEVNEFQRQALVLIATYVRDHRADWKGRTIFANLLVEDGDDIVVIARNHEHRLPLARCARRTMAAAKVFDTGEPQVVGDLAIEYPGGIPKRYKSILILPIYLGPKIAGALSLDSEELYHFDGEESELSTCLMPYTALLAWTLAPDRVSEWLRTNAEEGGTSR